jgi:predicted metal-binding transcription factor (methanogenesis marker protein 9)
VPAFGRAAEAESDFAAWHDAQSEVWARKERIKALGNCCPPQQYFPFVEWIAGDLRAREAA